MFDNEFYPTPKKLAYRMIEGVSLHYGHAILEPSAGKGDLLAALIDCTNFTCNRDDISAIEIDPNLRSILKDKGIRVVFDDFLTFNTLKRYDFILMNPPFSCGDKHLTKALSLLKSGGTCVCLLNTATLDNLYSNFRKTLRQQLDEWDAKIEMISDAFMDAERKTNVAVSLIRVTRPEETDGVSILLDGLKKAEEEQYKIDTEQTSLIDSDPIRAAITRCRLEQKAGIALLREYELLKRYLTEVPDGEYDTGDVFKIKVKPNEYIQSIRKKYWRLLFNMREFTEQLTSNLQTKLYNEIEDLQYYDFDEYNILALRLELSKKIIQSTEETIIKLFDEFSRKYHWDNEFSKNVHYFNGWKTNESWKINKKVILRITYGSSYDGVWSYELKKKLRDVEKVLAFFAGDEKRILDYDRIIDSARKRDQTKNIECQYVTINLYKKGTMHIVFKDDELLQRFNIFGCQHKKWLPPCYGKKSYNELNEDEKKVIDSFEGEESYREVCNRSDLLMDFSQAMPLCLVG
jgi:hypothetical protein